MNLSQLRKLVEDTRDLPDNTVLVVAEQAGTFEEVRGIRATEVLVFQRPRSQCPLGSIFHAKQDPESFGYRSAEELHEHARVESVLLVS